MPRWARILLTGFSFLLFFAGSPVLALVIFPVMRLGARDREDHRRRCTRLLHRGCRVFVRWMEIAGLIRAPLPVLPAELRGKPYVVIANHPTLIDVVIMLAAFEDLTCVTAGSWARSFVLGPLIRNTNYLFGPKSGLPESEHMIETMTSHVAAGHALLIFPEGTRSQRDRLNRFRRGAVEVAIAARVPLLPVFIRTDRPLLMKGVPFWSVPRRRAHITAEVMEIIDTTAPDIDARELNAELKERFDRLFAEAAAQREEWPIAALAS